MFLHVGDPNLWLQVLQHYSSQNAITVCSRQGMLEVVVLSQLESHRLGIFGMITLLLTPFNEKS